MEGCRSGRGQGHASWCGGPLTVTRRAICPVTPPTPLSPHQLLSLTPTPTLTYTPYYTIQDRQVQHKLLGDKGIAAVCVGMVVC